MTKWDEIKEAHSGAFLFVRSNSEQGEELTMVHLTDDDDPAFSAARKTKFLVHMTAEEKEALPFIPNFHRLNVRGMYSDINIKRALIDMKRERLGIENDRHV